MHPLRTFLFAAAASSVALVFAASALSGCGPNCVDDETFFRTEVQGKVLTPVCMGCHTENGIAADSDLILASAVRPDYLELNTETLNGLADLKQGSTSILLLKPRGDLDHGGGEVLPTNSEEYRILKEFISRTNNPRTCGGSGSKDDFGDGLALITPAQTLRKASLMLVGRLPTHRESEAVRYGGDAALEDSIRAMMEEPAFIDRVKELYNDVLLTDRYLPGSDAIGTVDYDRFPNLYWYEAAESREGEYRNAVNDSIAREPLELVAHIVKENKPFTEVLTADYVMVNDFTAMSYGLEGAEWPDLDDPRSFTFRPERIGDLPHAGVLTTSAFLNRYPTTPTNRNRHRAWFFFKTFLATDILKMADRPVDPTTSEVHNPTMNDTQCTVCHVVMDPVAGAFQNWDAGGAYVPPEDGWYAEMRPPGFDRTDLPSDNRAAALSWLAAQSVGETRFDYAMTRTVLAKFTGLPLLDPQDVGSDPIKDDAFRAQQVFLDALSTRFREGGYNVKDVVLDVVLSRYFRAAADEGASEGDLLLAGTAHFLTPEELNRKIRAVTGQYWTQSNGNHVLMDRYRMLYGGIDSNGVTTRLTEPNGIMANIGLRLGTEMACRSVSRDFVLPASQRRLFPLVEPEFQPLTNEGFEVPEVQEAIRKNIRYLHLRVLGEDLPLDHPEIQASYQLFYDTWAEGKAKLEADELSTRLPSACRATGYAGGSFGDEVEVEYDDDYTVRAWMAVMTYLLSDYRFFYE